MPRTHQHTEEPRESGEGWPQVSGRLFNQWALSLQDTLLSHGPQLSTWPGCGCGKHTRAVGASDVHTAHSRSMIWVTLAHRGPSRVGGRKNKVSAKTWHVSAPFHWTRMKSPHPPRVQLSLPTCLSLLWGLSGTTPCPAFLRESWPMYLSKSGLRPPAFQQPSFCWWHECPYLVFSKHKMPSGWTRLWSLPEVDLLALETLVWEALLLHAGPHYSSSHKNASTQIVSERDLLK